MPDEPTLGEVVRRLEGVAKQIADVASQLSNDRLLAAQTYVNRETYQSDGRLTDANHSALKLRVANLEEAKEDEQKWRRAASFQLAVVALGWLLTIALAFFAYSTRG